MPLSFCLVCIGKVHMLHAPRFMKRMKSLGGLLILGLAAGAASALAASAPCPEEMAEARAGLPPRLSRPPRARDASRAWLGANHDPLLRNTRGGGRPLTIGKTSYARGLYCHAVSQVLVRLPGPGKMFTAVVGVDTND